MEAATLLYHAVNANIIAASVAIVQEEETLSHSNIYHSPVSDGSNTIVIVPK